MKKSISTFWAVAFAIFATAQEKKDSITELQTIAVKATRASEDAPYTKTEITKEQLQRYNTGVDLPILLNQVTNAVTNSDAGTGVGYTGIRLRGSDISHINVTMNGVPVNDAEGQGTYFVDFADIVSSAQSIQIQRGVGSSTNGAGAFGANINLNTIDLPLQKSIKYNVDAGSYHTWKNTLKASTGLVDNRYCITARLSKISSDGYIMRSASSLYSGQFTAAYYVNKNTSIVLNYMAGKEKTGQAWNGVPQDSLLTNRTYNELGLKSDGTFYNNQTDNYTQHYLQLMFNHRINNYWKLNITPYYTRGIGYYEEYKLKQTLADYHLPNFMQDTTVQTSSDLIRQLWLNNHLIGINGSANAVYGKNNYTFGIAANTYLGNHYGIVKQVIATPMPEKKWYNLHANKTDVSAFAKAEWVINDALHFFGDLQFRHVSYTIDGFRKNPTLSKDLNYNFINPKLGITYILQSNNSMTQKIYASYGMANKEPNRNDLEAGVNSEPLPEQLMNLETGYSAKDKNNHLQANVFYMRYTNQLVSNGKINDVGEYTRVNVPQSFRAGLEVEMNNNVYHHQYFLNTNIAFSTNKIENFTEYMDDYDNGGQIAIAHQNTNISFSPNVVAGLTFSALPIKNKNLRIDIANKYVGKQYLDNTSNAARMLKAFYTTDVLANYAFTIAKLKWNARFGIYNLWNRKLESNGYTFSYLYGGQNYTSNYYFPQAGRRYTIGIGVEL
jgi:iron complex outermembrane receptor protein